MSETTTDFNLDNPEGRKNSRIRFTYLNKQAAMLDKQYERFEGLGDIDVPALREAAWMGLTTEQSSLLEDLTIASDDVGYEELGRKDIELSRQIGELTLRMEGLDPELKRIDTALAKAIYLSPTVAERLSRIAQQHRHEVLGGLATDMSVLQDQRRELDDLIGVAGQPWSLPRVPELPGRKQTIETENATQDDGIITEEEILMPVEPELRNHSKGEQVRRTYKVLAPQATHFLAFYVKESMGEVSVGEIITVADLMQFLYNRQQVGAPAAGERNFRGNITTLMGPVMSRQTVQPLLQQDNIILQYGWHRIKTTYPDGRVRYSRSTRIYRGLRQDDITPSVTEPVTEGSNEFLWDEVDQAVTAVEDLQPYAETVAAAPTPEMQPEPVTELEPEPEQELGTAGFTEVIEPEQAIEQKVPETPLWEVDFKTCVQDVLPQMIIDNVIQEDSISLRDLERRSSSVTLGTKTNISRVANAGLISKDAGRVAARRSTDVDHQVDAWQVVAMNMFNAKKEILGKGPRQKRARAIIEEVLAEHFEQQRRAQNH